MWRELTMPDSSRSLKFDTPLMAAARYGDMWMAKVIDKINAFGPAARELLNKARWQKNTLPAL
jgi:hypothetical protein